MLDQSCKRTAESQSLQLEGNLPSLAVVGASPFRMVATGCAGGDCPTVYEREGDEHYYVQGYNLSSNDLLHISTSSGESVVRIPKSLIDELVKARS